MRLDNKSRVNREIYARFCERLRVKLPGSTRHRDGFAIWSKRLEEGTYAMPFGKGEERRCELRSQELGALLSGIDLSQAKRRKRYRRAPGAMRSRSPEARTSSIGVRSFVPAPPASTSAKRTEWLPPSFFRQP